MFYLSELFLRLKYVILSFIILLSFLFNYKDSLISIVSISLINSSEKFGNFIYTNPTELIKVQLYSIVLFSFFFILPFLIWNCLEFFKSSLFEFEYKKIRKISVFLLFFFYASNVLINFILFPKI